MSGFAGITQFHDVTTRRAWLDQMQTALAHRGRDGQGLFEDADVGLVHTLNLLANLTVAPAPHRQPLTLSDCTIVCDARIDGRAELGSKLQTDQRLPDAELILRAYLRYGQACVDHLIGDFAFAIWDARVKTLFCARDQIGKRDFYYTQAGGVFAFSNELRPLKMIPHSADTLDERYIGDFLMLGEGFWIDKSSTPFLHIRRLEPAHTLTWTPDGYRVRRYWTLPMKDISARAWLSLGVRREGEIIEQYRSTLREAVKDRMGADRVLVTVSGGMDSSSTAALAFDLVSTGEVSAQTVAMTSVFSGIIDPEEAYAREIAAKLQFEDRHVFYEVKQTPFFRPYAGIANAIHSNFSPSNWVDFQRFMASHGKVAIFGYLGDALSSRAPLAQALRQMNPIAFAQMYAELGRFFGKRPALGSGIFSSARGGVARSESITYPFPAWIAPDFAQRQGLVERWQGYWAEKNKTNPLMLNAHLQKLYTGYDFHAHDESDAIDFTPVDTVDPFADLRVIDLLTSLPTLPWFYKKYLGRRAMSGILPDSVVHRPKQIFGDVTGYLLAKPENQWIDAWQPMAFMQQYVVRDKVPPVTGTHAQIDASQAVHLRPLTLELWLETEVFHQKST